MPTDNNYAALEEALKNLPKQPDYLPVRTIHVQNYSRNEKGAPFGWDVDVDWNNNVLGITTLSGSKF